MRSCGTARESGKEELTAQIQRVPRFFGGWGDSRARGFAIITREILAIDNRKPIGFI